MEKNQHNSNNSPAPQQDNNATGMQPGQQLPPDAEQGMETKAAVPGQPEQHSESSFPQQDGETLGTPWQTTDNTATRSGIGCSAVPGYCICTEKPERLLLPALSTDIWHLNWLNA